MHVFYIILHTIYICIYHILHITYNIWPWSWCADLTSVSDYFAAYLRTSRFHRDKHLTFVTVAASQISACFFLLHQHAYPVLSVSMKPRLSNFLNADVTVSPRRGSLSCCSVCTEPLPVYELTFQIVLCFIISIHSMYFSVQESLLSTSYDYL